MLDIKFIRENPQLVKQKLALRNANYDSAIDEILHLDDKRRQIILETEQKKAQQNKVSRDIPKMKQQGIDTSELMSRLKALSDEITEGNLQLSSIENALSDILLGVPNLPSAKVPRGKDDTQNVEIRRVGTPRRFDFEPLAHWNIGQNLHILDPQTAAKVTGSRFHFYKGLGAKLERAVINFFLDSHTQNGYTEILPPFIANRASMTATSQLPKFEEDMFAILNTDYFLIPTAEVPVTNMHRDEILDAKSLPIKYCAYSACFRGEAGSAGRDTRGLIRQHQFNKVELVKFVDAETSYDELEKLVNDAERVLKALDIPYRVVALSTGDIGFSSAFTYDIEIWMPSYGRYVEVSSCSNFEDYQARRASIRMRKEGQKPCLVHTLNGSGVAVGRTVASILENYQNADGSVEIPEVLREYVGGLTKIKLI